MRVTIKTVYLGNIFAYQRSIYVTSNMKERSEKHASLTLSSMKQELQLEIWSERINPRLSIRISFDFSF